MPGPLVIWIRDVLAVVARFGGSRAAAADLGFLGPGDLQKMKWWRERARQVPLSIQQKL